MVAPETRNPTSATGGTVRSAIFPTIGHVANRICTMINAT
jgi:hypothetical protein